MSSTNLAAVVPVIVTVSLALIDSLLGELYFIVNVSPITNDGVVSSPVTAVTPALMRLSILYVIVSLSFTSYCT